MIPQSKITELFDLWSRLPFSKLLSVDQLRNRFQIEFVVNTDNPQSNPFLARLQKITIDKHPTGSVSWIGYYSIENFGRESGVYLGDGFSSQLKKYKIDFIDSSLKDEIDPEKLDLYVKKLEECLKSKNKIAIK